MLVLIASVVLGVGGWLMLVGLAPARPTVSQLIAASQDAPPATAAVGLRPQGLGRPGTAPALWGRWHGWVCPGLGRVRSWS